MKGTSGGRSGRRQRLFAIAVVPVAALAVLGSVHGSSAAGVSFHTDYVDPARGGGEPFVIYSHAGHDLVFSSHEGTTLTQSSNVTGGTNCDINVGDPLNSGGYICTYDNQVNIWSSSDGGNTWQHQLGNPTATGFSDPSLSEDECTSSGQCNIYDTGIDLANDAMFASPDGGNTWAAGTAQCHDGDRPWLAGGKYGEGFLATNTEESGHTIFHATVTQDPVTHQNVALTCSTTGIGDGGGQGQIYYNHHDGSLLEPKVVNNHYGIGVLPNASAFNTTFIDRTANGPAFGPGRLSHWPAIAISTDTSAAAPNGTVYIVWDTAPRDTNAPHNGCSGATGSAIGGNTLLQNAVYLAYSNDEGQTWSQPITIANSGGTVQWPWIAAGANGNVSVVWYQANQVTDPDCDSANLVCTAAGSSCPTQWSIAEENLYGVTSGSPTTERVNVVQDPVPGASTSNPHPNGTIHVGKVCEGGTTCAATGEDRRLGDYFTNALDQNGCVMIASGDTIQNDPTTGLPLPNSLPIFAKQVSGPSLTTGADCSGITAPVPEAGTIIGLAGAGAVGALLVTQVRRRRTRTALS
jgi:hypothetical protein